jgi:hypothetical protein
MSYAKKYYRKEGRCIMRTSDVKCTEIQLPDIATEKLPLVLHTITFPDKVRFDESIKEMEEVEEDVFDQYMLSFTHRVKNDIENPMTERSIKRELNKQQHLNYK